MANSARRGRAVSAGNVGGGTSTPLVPELDPASVGLSGKTQSSREFHWLPPRPGDRVGDSSRDATVRMHSTGSWMAANGVVESFRRTTSQMLTNSFHTVLTRGSFPSSDRGAPRTFWCAICMENVRIEERLIFKNCGDEHGHCRSCLSQYVQGLVADGRVNGIICPHVDCNAEACAEEVQSWTDSDTFAKFQRFKQIKADPSLRQCPRCQKLCKHLLDARGEIVAEMRCDACEQEFCYYHSNAHVGRPCATYRKEIAKQERLANEALSGTKPCASCGITTDKISGCNHMTCAGCGGNWCWTCGEVLTNVGWHYSPTNPSGCQQFAERSERGPLMRCLKVAMVPVSAFSILLGIVCSLIFLVIFPVVAAVVGICVKFNCNILAWVAAFLAFLPFLIFQALWMILVLPFYGILCCCCRATDQHRNYLLQVPFNTVVSFLEMRGVAG